MEEKQKTFGILTSEVVSYLQKLSYSDSRISQYQSAWRRVSEYMKDNGLQYYSATVGEAFIYHLIGERIYDDLDRWEKEIIQCVNVLTEFWETGSIKFRRNRKFRKLHGSIGQNMLSYIAYKKSYGITRDTEDNYKYHFEYFLNYMNDTGIMEFKYFAYFCFIQTVISTISIKPF